MTAIAREIFDSAPPDPLISAGTNPCSFSAALDTVCFFCHLETWLLILPRFNLQTPIYPLLILLEIRGLP
jgi:hypothetical protein